MKRRGWIVAAGVLALVVGLVAWLSGQRPAAAAYTTATVAQGSIEQRFTSSGSVERENEVELSFDTPGTVTGVLVSVGEQVAAGDPIATVDAAPLRVSLLQARAQLAQAQAVLDADLKARANGGARAAIPGASPAPGASRAPTGGTTKPPAKAPTKRPSPPVYVTGLQTSMASLSKAVKAQQAACAPVYQLGRDLDDLLSKLPTDLPTAPTPPAPTPTRTPSAAPTATPSPTASGSPSATPTASPTATSSPTPTPTRTASPGRSAPRPAPTLSPDELRKVLAQVQACSTAMVALATAEQQAGTAIVTASQGMAKANEAAAAQLQKAQRELVAQAEAAAKAAAQKAIADAQRQLAAQAQRAAGARVTAATIASDRARVTQAEQAVGRAERALDAATLTTPVSGTVGSLDLAAGQSSAGRQATVVGEGGARIKVEIPLSVRPLVTVGMPASVGLVGADATMSGRVTGLAVLPSSTSGTPTYTATVVADDPDQVLRSGTKAEVVLPLRAVTDVTTVPASAVTMVTDTTGTVQVVADARAASATQVEVVTGAFGQGRIEIVSGLEPGQLVVLADRREPVPGGLAQYQPRQSTASPTPTRR